jgi:hypothetical protein
MYAYILAVLLLYSCKPAQQDTSGPADPGFKPGGTMSDLVYNPIRPDGTIDSSYLPIALWQDTLFHFGEVKEGDIITRDFTFRNVGTAPLLITNASSTCGCTVPSYPKEPIPQDSTAVIRVSFNTLNRTGAQTKEVTIFANTIPNQTTLYLTGRVEPSKK